ncbi:hydantoinase/oxoprolinase family protein [Bacillus sp. FSL W7-1321]
MSYRIGIDVGGTNTDAVLLDHTLHVIAKAKQPTTEDVMTGIWKVLTAILEESAISPGEIGYAMLGTTHCTNAIVERKQLNKVGIIRLCKPAATAVPPLAAWPDDLKAAVGEHHYLVAGGYEYDGALISELDENEIRSALEDMKENVKSIAVTGIFSPARAEQELKVARLAHDIMPGVPISLSHQIGSIGLLERENATILNAALQTTIRTVVSGFREALSKLGIPAQIFIGQNDGTLMEADYAIRYPILTIGCGPTNSIRGASFLSGLKDALVLDIGGTTSDIGVLSNGFPRQSAIAVDVGGIRTNFRMPDILSVGLGGGTIIRTDEQGAIKVGPDSVGYRLLQEARSFGGETLTATDVVLAVTDKTIAGADTSDLDSDACQQAYKQMIEKLEVAIDQMKTSKEPVPVILTGGGSILVNSRLTGASEVIKPDHHDVANAIGAALGTISGEAENIYALEGRTYEDAVEEAKQNAIGNAVEAGAVPATVKIVSVEDVPLAYMPGNSVFIKVKAVGELDTK